MNKLKTYFEDVVKEMRKVSWPKRKELIGNTVITLVGSLVISLFIFVADRGISGLLDLIYR